VLPAAPNNKNNNNADDGLNDWIFYNCFLRQHAAIAICSKTSYIACTPHDSNSLEPTKERNMTVDIPFHFCFISCITTVPSQAAGFLIY